MRTDTAAVLDREGLLGTAGGTGAAAGAPLVDMEAALLGGQVLLGFGGERAGFKELDIGVYLFDGLEADGDGIGEIGG